MIDERNYFDSPVNKLEEISSDNLKKFIIAAILCNMFWEKLRFQVK